MNGYRRTFDGTRNWLSGLLIAAAVGVSPSYATEMTAGVVLREMKGKELFSYVYGIVDGMAYARFRKDSIARGQKDEQGMACIYNWFFADNAAAFGKVEAQFRAHEDMIPPVIVAAIIKKECGE